MTTHNHIQGIYIGKGNISSKQVKHHLKVAETSIQESWKIKKSLEYG